MFVILLCAYDVNRLVLVGHEQHGIIEQAEERLPTPQNPRASRVEAVVQSAWVRRLTVLSIEQLAIAVALIFGGGILMLLLGTQILNWYWLVLLGVAGLGIGAWRVRARIFGRYRVAQLLDRTLGLHDSLSSAWFLRSRPDPEPAPPVRFQLEYAERLAATVYPCSALPITRGKTWILAGGLAAVAFGLFAVRYLVTNSLSLERSLVPLYHGDVYARREPAPPLKNRSLDDPSGSDRSRKEAFPTGNAPKSDRQQESGSNEIRTGLATPEQAAPPQSQLKADNGTSDGSPTDKPGKADQNHDRDQGTQKGSATKDQQTGDQQSQSGLMDKMKDALSSLMAKMRENANAQKSQQESQRSTEGQQASEKTAGKNDPNGDSQKNAANQQASQDQSADGQPQGQTTEKTQSAQGRNSNQPSDKEGADSQSGVGRQDGDKAARESEQLKAMGKLAEIIGKRSASVTGDMVVENPSGKQGLKTGYSRHLGQHADLGGEINRDEIPLMYQQYVREYMQQIHNQPKRQ